MAGEEPSEDEFDPGDGVSVIDAPSEELLDIEGRMNDDAAE